MVLETLTAQLRAAAAASDEAKIMSAFVSKLSRLKPNFFWSCELRKKKWRQVIWVLSAAEAGRDA